MKRLWSFGLTTILSLTLTLAPVQAQTQGPTLVKSDESAASVDPPASAVPSGTTMDEKSAENGSQVLSALPPSDDSNPPGRTSRAVIVAGIIAAAAIAVGLYLIFRGGKTPGTVLVPGTATVGPPGK